MLLLPIKNRSGGLAAMVLCLAAAWLVESTLAWEGSASRFSNASSDRSRQGGADKSRPVGSRRLREGTVITDQDGYFREDGDGAIFVADTGMEFGALPNLNLERVVQLLKNAEQPSRIRWSVAGKVTEFAGQNFLLLSRAVYKSAVSPPLPARVGQ